MYLIVLFSTLHDEVLYYALNHTNPPEVTKQETINILMLFSFECTILKIDFGPCAQQTPNLFVQRQCVDSQQQQPASQQLYY